jgi:hypothetical protein
MISLHLMDTVSVFFSYLNHLLMLQAFNAEKRMGYFGVEVNRSPKFFK